MKKLFSFCCFLLLAAGVMAGEVTHLMSSYNSNSTPKTVTDDQSVVWNLSQNASSSNQLPATWATGGSSTRGLCYSTPNSATITSQSTFTNVTKIVVDASSNMTNSTGTISIKVGNTTIGNTANLTKTNHATYEFASVTPLTGVITLTVNQSANSVWVAGLKITTSAGGSQGGDPGDGDDDGDDDGDEYEWNYTDASSQPTSETADLSFAAGNFTFTFGSAAYNNSHFKWYASKNFTITAPTGYVMTKILFEYSDAGYNGRNKISASTGTYSDGEWNGKTNELVLTNGDTRQCRLSKITITYHELGSGSFTLTNINGAGWGTYYTDFDFVMPTNVEGRLMKDVEGTIKAVATYAAGTVVPANTGLLLNGTAGNYNVVETLTAATISAEGNLLKGLVEEGETTGGNVYYKLANDSEDGLGWFWGAAEGAAFTSGAHKAYLALDAAPSLAPSRILINDENKVATAIDNVAANNVVKFVKNGQLFIMKAGRVYNVAGQIVR